MVRDNVQILLELYYRPLRALSSVLDKGSVLFAVIAAILTNVLMGMVLAGGMYNSAVKQRPSQGIARPAPNPNGDEAGPPLEPLDLGGRLIAAYVGGPLSGVTALVPVALFFVPSAVVFAGWIAGLGGAGVLLRRDYMPMLACAMMVWTASHLPVALLALVPGAAIAAIIAGQLLFLAYSAASVRTVMGTSWGQAVGTTLLASIVMVAGQFAYGIFGGGSFYFASPFLLYYAYIMLQQDVRLLAGGLSSRQSLRRHLEASTLNPRDYDAHYQLGLIYQQRRNYPEAIARFERAIEIAPAEEADAHYQLGRIAREQKRHEDARKYFVAALGIDDKHFQSEVWRDLGATDYELGRLDQALAELQKYADRRGYDPEGLYWLGMTLKKLDRPADAREAFERTLEAARTTPAHRRRQTGKWGSLAQAELRTLRKS
jgi:Tfp pilus assembly protein PilF